MKGLGNPIGRAGGSKENKDVRVYLQGPPCELARYLFLLSILMKFFLLFLLFVFFFYGEEISILGVRYGRWGGFHFVRFQEKKGGVSNNQINQFPFLILDK
jgi:hypothetical protein